MILLVHMIFGAAVGYTTYNLTDNLFLAVILAWLAHYFLDIFPHIEYLESAETSITNLQQHGLKRQLEDVVKVVADFFLGLLFIYMFSSREPMLYFFGLVSIIPDGVTVIYTLRPFPFLAKHQEFHAAIQYLTKYKKPKAPIEMGAQPADNSILFNALVSFPVSILTQVAAVIASVLLLSS